MASSRNCFLGALPPKDGKVGVRRCLLFSVAVAVVGGVGTAVPSDVVGLLGCSEC